MRARSRNACPPDECSWVNAMFIEHWLVGYREILRVVSRACDRDIRRHSGTGFKSPPAFCLWCITTTEDAPSIDRVSTGKDLLIGAPNHSVR